MAEPINAAPGERKRTLTDKDIVCLGHLRRVFPMLERLRRVGCQRDKAANRELFFDDYCKLVLLYTWNPCINSIRMLQQAVGLKTVAKAMDVKRFSLGSFSESPRVFEPPLLKEIIGALAAQARLVPQDPRLADLKLALTLVDGTVLTALPRLARAACEGTRYCTARDGRALYGWRLHTQFDLQTFTPSRIDRTGAKNSGTGRERQVLAATLRAGRCYVMDGGYGEGSLFDQIIDIGSCFACRIREVSVYTLLEERELSREALDGDIFFDGLVQWGGKHPIRLVQVKVKPRPARGGGDSKSSDVLVIATNLVDLPAELISLIYLQRYSVELFFGFFKNLLGMRHLISQRQEGIDIQAYCAVIVCLLINLITGARPNKAMVTMVGFYLMGLADEEELLAYLNKPDNRGAKKRAKDALFKKLGF